jgi:hypothetical protein
MYLNGLKRKEINMGYRCPGCGKDFGIDKEALYHHLDFESGECSTYAYAALAGLRGISLELANGDIDDCIEDLAEACKDETFTESIYSISTLPVRYDGIFDFSITVNDMILSIFGLAKHLDIDLLWHIEQKIRYNELRPMLNGKKY